MPLRKRTLYLGIKGHLVALDESTGAEHWRTKLKGAEFVSVATDDERIYAGARGEIWALDPYDGRIIWHNPMKGLGWGISSILTGGASDATAGAAASAAAKRRQAAAG